MSLALFSFSGLLWLFGIFCGSTPILGLFFFFSFLFFYICEKCHWSFDRDCSEYIDGFVWYLYFNNVNYSYSWTCNFFLFFVSSSISFIIVLRFSLYRSFIFLVKFITKYFIAINANEQDHFLYFFFTGN